jgi:hypothetical protein
MGSIDGFIQHTKPKYLPKQHCNEPHCDSSTTTAASLNKVNVYSKKILSIRGKMYVPVPPASIFLCIHANAHQWNELYYVSIDASYTAGKDRHCCSGSKFDVDALLWRE